jgi:putative Mg2+ transporter-C (MgtC) family protein
MTMAPFFWTGIEFTTTFAVGRGPNVSFVTDGEHGSYTIHAHCDPEAVSDVRDPLFVELDTAQYPIREIELLSKDEDLVGLAANLIPTSVNSSELDIVVVNLKKDRLVKNATWTASTTT